MVLLQLKAQAGWPQIAIKCAALWRAVFGTSATESTSWLASGRYENVRRCGGLSMVLLQLKAQAGWPQIAIKCAALWRAVYGTSATESTSGSASGRYENVRRCGGLSMVFLQLKAQAGWPQIAIKCAALWRAVFGTSATESTSWLASGRYENVRRCGGLYYGTSATESTSGLAPDRYKMCGVVEGCLWHFCN